jgi:integrase
VADSITPADIAEWFAKMADERNWTPATINRYRAAMSKAFKIGIQNGKVTSNPARLVPQRKEPAGKLRFLTEEEEVRLRLALKGRPHSIPQLDIALHTGMRKSEQFSVTWDQVDFTQKYIHLNVTKNGSDRYVSLNSEAIRALNSLKETHARLKLPEDSTLFVSAQNKPMADPREWFASACEEAKIQGVTFITAEEASALVLAHKGAAFLTREAAWRISSDEIAIRPLADRRHDAARRTDAILSGNKRKWKTDRSQSRTLLYH